MAKDTHIAVIGAEAGTHILCILPSSLQARQSVQIGSLTVPDFVLWLNIWWLLLISDIQNKQEFS
jgi:hypothetical protein